MKTGNGWIAEKMKTSTSIYPGSHSPQKSTRIGIAKMMTKIGIAITKMMTKIGIGIVKTMTNTSISPGSHSPRNSRRRPPSSPLKHTSFLSHAWKW